MKYMGGKMNCLWPLEKILVCVESTWRRWLEMRFIKCFVQTMKLKLELHGKDILISEHDLSYLLGIIRVCHIGYPMLPSH